MCNFYPVSPKFAECMVQYTRKDIGGRDTVEN